MNNQKLLRQILQFIAISAILFLTSCNKKSTTEPDDNEVVISDNVILPDEDPEITIDEIGEDQITMTFTGDVPDIVENDILVGGDEENGGYLRKVSSVTINGNTMEIQTAQAVLTEAIENGSLDTTLSLNFGGANRSLYGLELVRKMDGVTVRENGIDISGTELFNDNFNGTDVLISIPTGTVTFTPDLNLAFDIKWFRHLHEFHAIASGQLDFNFDIRGEFSGSIADFNNDDDPIELASFSHSFFQAVGVVPVWETVTLTFEAGYSVDMGYSGAVQAGFDSSIGIECGARWLEGSWSEVWNPSYDFNWHPPEWNAEAHVQIRGYVRPTISIELYSMAGPYLDVEPYARFDANVEANPPTWQWGLYGGMESTLGFQIHVLHWDLAEWNTELLDPPYEILIYGDNGELETITVTSPNGGEDWQMGSSHTITWDDNISGNVKIELYRSGSIETTITSSTNSDGSYSWNIPNSLTESSGYKVKITSTSDSSVNDYSNSNFTISEQPPEDYITVTSPNGGEDWQMGSSHTITWDDNISGNVKIELYRSGSLETTITGSTNSDGSYSWNIPNSLTESSGYKVKITSTSDSSVNDYSDSNFTISEPPPVDYITVTSPNGGEDWQMGSSHTITWDDNISGNVKIELYRSGSIETTITSSTNSDGSYSWNIPNSLTESSGYKVKITSTSDSSVNDYGDSNFTISEPPPVDYITVTSPNGGEDWQMGSSHTITWDDNISGNVKIELYRSGSIETTITGSTNSDGSYSWNIPNSLTESSGYKVKITSTSDSSVNDYSDSNFTISESGGGSSGDFEMVSLPGGSFQMGDIWSAGSSNELPVHTVTLSSFQISSTEITNQQYADYLSEALASGDITATSSSVTGPWSGGGSYEYLDLNDGDCQISYSGGAFTVDNGKENHPVIEVSWYGAVAFAEHYGYRLPTEAEWEYAARGVSGGADTKWSGTSTESELPDYAWYSANNNPSGTKEVGTKLPNANGLYDMSGNVWEWCSDWYSSSYYNSSPEVNPQGPESGSNRVGRGGGCSSYAYYLRCSYRNGDSPNGAGAYLGFRISRTN